MLTAGVIGTVTNAVVVVSNGPRSATTLYVLAAEPVGRRILILNVPVHDETADGTYQCTVAVVTVPAAVAGFPRSTSVMLLRES